MVGKTGENFTGFSSDNINRMVAVVGNGTKGLDRCVSDSVGSALGLCCAQHPDTEIEVRQADEFLRYSPQGGCELTCDRRLSKCGHRCQAKCHSESLHQAFPCPQPCQRLHSPCSHKCQKATCGEDCGVCRVSLDNVLLPCSHSKDNVLCYQVQEPDKIRCDVWVERSVPKCGHTIKVKCWQDVTKVDFICLAPCKDYLACGHRCPGSCGRCQKKDTDDNLTIEHMKCTKVCGKPFPACNHTCQKLCHDGSSCALCLSPCEVRY